MRHLGFGLCVFGLCSAPVAAWALTVPDVGICDGGGFCLRIVQNATSTAILAKSNSGIGIWGESVTNIGGLFTSGSEGTALVAHNTGTGWAAQFEGETSFTNRQYIWENPSATAGIWYADADGWARQFAGVKVHSSTGTSQQWGIYQNGAWKFYFRGDGSAFKPGGGSWSSASDARCKGDVVSYSEGLEVIEQIRPVWYRYNGRGGTPNDGAEHVGVIAQEVERLVPYVVAEIDTDDPGLGKMKTVDPGAFTYMLINSVKELSVKNRTLQAQADKQQRETAELRAEVEQLKKAIYGRK